MLFYLQNKFDLILFTAKNGSVCFRCPGSFVWRSNCTKNRPGHAHKDERRPSLCYQV